MKKMIALLALLLAVLLPMTAMAVTVTGTSYPSVPDRVTLDKVTPAGTFKFYGRGDDNMTHYWLTTPDGVEITPHYYRISAESGTNVATYIDGVTLNDAGFLNMATGEIIMPAEYGHVNWLSDDWCIGTKLTPSTDPDARYRTFTGDERYEALETDVYYRGQKVATLTAEETGNFSAAGDYLCAYSDAAVIWISATGERRDYESRYNFRAEYAEDYSTDTITHIPTGQLAFCAGCTLTADEVEECFYEMDDKILDLQGNVLYDLSTVPMKYTSLYATYGDYLVLSATDPETNANVKAVMNTKGEIIIPFIIKTLPNLNSDEPFFEEGILPAVTIDGVLNIYDATGAVLNSWTLPAENTYFYSGFYESAPAIMHKENGVVTIITATSVLDLSAYESVSYSPSKGGKLICVEQDNKWGCLDLNGNLVVPFTFRYCPTISEDSTLVLGSYTNEDYDTVYVLYTLSY